jgi:hypothetical protein
MAKLNFRKISEPYEIENFFTLATHHSGVRLPSAYAERATIYGAFIGDHLAGGYMLVTKPDYRTLMFVPDHYKREHAFFGNSAYEMMEINALWLGTRIKTPQMQLRFWTNLILTVFFCRKKYLLLLSNTKNKTILRLVQMANPTILYEGPPQLAGGQSTHQSIRVGYTTRWSILLHFPRYLKEIADRKRRFKETRRAQIAH